MVNKIFKVIGQIFFFYQLAYTLNNPKENNQSNLVNVNLLNQLNENFLTDISLGGVDTFKVAIDTDIIHQKDIQDVSLFEKEDRIPETNLRGLTWIPSNHCNNCDKFGFQKKFNCELSLSCVKVSKQQEYMDSLKLRLKGKRYQELVSLEQNIENGQKQILPVTITIFLVEHIEYLTVFDNDSENTENNPKQVKDEQDLVGSQKVYYQGILNIQQVQLKLLQQKKISNQQFSLYLSTKSCQNGFMMFGGIDNNFSQNDVSYFDVQQMENNELQQWILPIESIQLDQIPLNTIVTNEIGEGSDNQSEKAVSYIGKIDSKVKDIYMNKNAINQMQVILQQRHQINCSLKIINNFDQGLVCDESNIDKYPDIIIRIQQNEFILSPEEYFGKCQEEIVAKKCFLKIILNTMNENIYLGQLFLRKHYTIFDFEKTQIGFAGVDTKKIGEKDIYLKILEFQLQSNELKVFGIVIFMALSSVIFVTFCHLKIKYSWFQHDIEQIYNNDGMGKYGQEKNETFNSEESERKQKKGGFFQKKDIVKPVDMNFSQEDDYTQQHLEKSQQSGVSIRISQNKNATHIKLVDEQDQSKQSSTKEIELSQSIKNHSHSRTTNEILIQDESEISHGQQKSHIDVSEEEEQKDRITSDNNIQQQQINQHPDNLPQMYLNTQGSVEGENNGRVNTKEGFEGFGQDFDGRIKTDITNTENTEENENQLPIHLDQQRQDKYYSQYNNLQ